MFALVKVRPWIEDLLELRKTGLRGSARSDFVKLAEMAVTVPVGVLLLVDVLRPGHIFYGERYFDVSMLLASTVVWLKLFIYFSGAGLS